MISHDNKVHNDYSVHANSIETKDLKWDRILEMDSVKLNHISCFSL